MEWFEALALLLGTIMLLMAVGMPIALAFLPPISSVHGCSWGENVASPNF